MVCGLVEYDNSTGAMIAARRVGKVTQMKNMPKFTEQQQLVIDRVEIRAKFRAKQLREWCQSRRGKDIEVTRGTTILEPRTGVTVWKLKWGHCPGRGGAFDAVGLCSGNFESFGPAAGPLLGSPPPQAERDESLEHSHAYSYQRYQPPQSTQTSTCSIGIYASGLVLHGGEPTATIDSAIDDQTTSPGLIFTKDSCITLTFDSDKDRGTLTMKIDDQPECFCQGNLFDRLGSEALYPCISLCPRDEGDDDNDDDSAADGEAGATDTPIDRVATSEPPPLEAVTNPPKVTILSVDDESSMRPEAEPEAEPETGAEAQAADAAAAGGPAQLGVSLAQSEMAAQEVVTKATTTTTATTLESSTTSKAVWMYEVPEGPWACYDDVATNTLEKAHSSGDKQAVVPCMGALYKVIIDGDEEPASTNSRCGCCGNRGHLQQHCPQMGHQSQQSGMRQVPHNGDGEAEDGEAGQRVQRMVIDNWPDDAWKVISVQHRPPSTLSGQGALSVLQKIWSAGETMDGRVHGLGFVFLYELLQGSMRCAVMSRGYDGGGYGGYGGYGGGYGGYGGGASWQRPRTSDGHRFAQLLAQLFTDRTQKTILGSMINVLVRNRRVGRRLPPFYDTRIDRSSHVLNAFVVDDSSPANGSKKKGRKKKGGRQLNQGFSFGLGFGGGGGGGGGGFGGGKGKGGGLGPERVPLADLLGELIPLFKRLKRTRGALRFPPPPPYPQLPSPPTHTVVRSDDGAKREGLMAQLSDYSCALRQVGSLTASDVVELCEAVQYDPTAALGAAAAAGGDVRGRVLAVRTKEEFAAILKCGDDEPPLVVVNFFSARCGPCVAMEPVYKTMAQSVACALFCKVDCDEVDDLVREHKIESLPTIKLFRCSPGATSSPCIATVVGGGKPGLAELMKAIHANLTADENAMLEQRCNGPEFVCKEVGRLAVTLATSDDEIRLLTTTPLATINLAALATLQPRLVPLQGKLPFDLSAHPTARSLVAKQMLSRMEKDVEWWAERANKGTTHQLTGLNNLDLESFFSSSAGPQEMAAVQAALNRLQHLLSALQRIRLEDAAFVEACVPLILHAANHVNLDSDRASRHEKVKFVLRRYSSQECTVFLEFLYGALLSSKCMSDLTTLNPHLPETVGIRLLQAVTIAILRSSRIGQTNRCIAAVKQLTLLLTKQLIIASPAARAKGRTSVVPKIQQYSEAILNELTARRHFFTGAEDQRSSFDPRFLVFEFTWNILLRKKQIEIVLDLMDNLKREQSKVKQMIMGAGKTTVVAPLLALMLADGASLVLSVVPRALVEMSRTRMRETFAVIVQKRVYTLVYDRSTVMRQNNFETLLNAKRNRGIVVATPTTVKSIMLSSIELQMQITEARAAGTTRGGSITGSQGDNDHVEEDGTRTLAKIAAAAATAEADSGATMLQGASVSELERRLGTTQEVLKLFNEGVMLMDEVR